MFGVDVEHDAVRRRSETGVGSDDGGPDSRFGASPHRVMLYVHTEHDRRERGLSSYEKNKLGKKAPPEEFGLVADVVGEDKFKPDDYDEEEDDLTEYYTLGPNVQGFNCRVLDKEQPFKDDRANWVDTWDTSNCIPRRVQLTFWMKPVDEGKEPYPIVRVVEIPLWDVSQNPITATSDGDDSAGVRRGDKGGGGNGGTPPGGAGGAPGTRPAGGGRPGGMPPGGPGGIPGGGA